VDHNAQAAAGGGAPSLDEGREQYEELLLRRFESGALEAYEYTRRVGALGTATSASAMAEIVDAPATPEAKPALDPVDLALLARAPARPTGDRRKPFVWLAVVGVFFFVLLLIGMWLVAHTRALPNSGNVGVVPAGALGAPHAAVGVPSAAP
jgi:hypothetical protein